MRCADNQSHGRYWGIKLKIPARNFKTWALTDALTCLIKEHHIDTAELPW